MKERGEEWSQLMKIVRNMSERHGTSTKLLGISTEHQIWNLIVFELEAIQLYKI